ncbi:substrate-binding periplasmic protein [Duganella violaceipulchra]|uniref:ABC-type amino acid transport substrate-binding protein n=1 Tax=Duganella violaceipulchra TaxID=2849652 RepID=A0AA41HKN4_9BURK|nr:transporter substrate-binding domain-containing protein [Duganella violaceicalia]MBV6325583.1 transporter substrate-binding domain-containing protein [Duganella violaceicalia]MCP2012731.1 ABC-type amino acid transport substrate-binding protein [Duganella violaceicalia]
MSNFRLRAGALIPLVAALLGVAAPAHADWDKIRLSGSLKVAVYEQFAPFSERGAGIDVDVAQALAAKLGLKLSLLPFPAGENLGDDLRNMVWKGHYLGYGPADILLHVPVEPQLMNENGKVTIFAPYHVETVRLVRSARSMPSFEGIDALSGKTIGVEKVSIAAMVLLGEGNGRFREKVRIFDTAAEALEQLKSGQLDAVLANRSEIDAVFRDDPAFPLNEVAFQRLPRAGWAVGMAVRKDDQDMARLLQAAVNEMKASGELQAIFARYGVHEQMP